jgi:hypothetical protein
VTRSAAGRQAIDGEEFIDSGGSRPFAVDASREHSPGPPAARYAAKPGFPPRKPGPRAIGSPLEPRVAEECRVLAIRARWKPGNLEVWQTKGVIHCQYSLFLSGCEPRIANTPLSSAPFVPGPQNRSRAAKSRRPRGRVAAKSRCERSLAGGEPARAGLTWHSHRWEDSSEAMASRPVAATSRYEHSHREFAAKVQGLIGIQLGLRPRRRASCQREPDMSTHIGSSLPTGLPEGARP